jgi:hypothetical protein
VVMNSGAVSITTPHAFYAHTSTRRYYFNALFSLSPPFTFGLLPPPHHRSFIVTQVRIGSRNQRGFLENLLKMGFTTDKAFNELIANCIDAGASKVQFQYDCSLKKYFLTDNGCGMSRDGLRNMFDVERENHSDDKSMGTAGFGSKPSLLKLSIDDKEQKHPTVILTRVKDGDYLKCIVPWDTMFEKGQWDDMISCVPMTEEEITFFCEKLKGIDNDCKSGTIIELHGNDEMSVCLDEQFQNSTFKYEDRLSIIFGKCAVDISYDKNDGLPPVVLKKYNYMDGNANDYYCGKKTRTIQVFKDENGISQFGCYNEEDDSYYGFRVVKKNCKKEFEKLLYTRRWQLLAEFQFTTAARRDNGIFDVTNPLEPKASMTITDYDKQFFSGKADDLKDHLSKMKLIRNNQCVSLWHLSCDNHSLARSNGEKFFEYITLRAEVDYQTVSSHDNLLDRIFGIQQNKTQNQNQFPLALERLLQYFRKEHKTEIWKYFKQVIANHAVDESTDVEPEVDELTIVESATEPIRDDEPAVVERIPDEPTVVEAAVVEPTLVEPTVDAPASFEPFPDDELTIVDESTLVDEHPNTVQLLEGVAAIIQIANGSHSSVENGSHSSVENGSHSSVENGSHSSVENGSHSSVENGSHSSVENGDKPTKKRTAVEEDTETYNTRQSKRKCLERSILCFQKAKPCIDEMINDGRTDGEAFLTLVQSFKLNQ